MNHEHHLIIYAGLGNDRHGVIRSSLPTLRQQGYIPHRRIVGWDRNITPEQLVREEVAYIDNEIPKEQKTSCLGTSAGGILALLVYRELKDRIHNVVCISSKLQEFPWYALGNYSPNRSELFDNTFHEFDKRRTEFSDNDKKHILTVRGCIDEIVPPSISVFEYARNIQVCRWNAVGHVFIIRQALQNPDFAPDVWKFLS